MTAWEVQMQFSHVLGHVVHFVITDSKWDTHIQDCPSMWYIYIYVCVTYRYTVAISWHTVLNNTQEFWVPGLGDLHAPRWDLRNRPTSMACTPCESKKMWRNWAEAYNRSAPLLGFVGGFNGWLFIVFLTSLRRHPTVDLCQVDIFSGYVWAFEEAAVIWRCLIPR